MKKILILSALTLGSVSFYQCSRTAEEKAQKAQEEVQRDIRKEKEDVTRQLRTLRDDINNDLDKLSKGIAAYRSGMLPGRAVVVLQFVGLSCSQIW